MQHLSSEASDEEVIRLIDAWAALLEAGDYAGAYGHTDHEADMGWTPALIQEVIQGYGDARPGQHVTVLGTPTDITQRKDVARRPERSTGAIGTVHYDLNIDGVVSDLTAIFFIYRNEKGLHLSLNDIHVM